MDFRTITDNGRYGVRVTGLIIRNNQLLSYKVDDQYHLVGGALTVGESSYKAIIREVKEELGLDCKVCDLMFIVENKFDYQGELHHMIEFHYKIDISGETPDYILDGEPYKCEWLPLDSLHLFDLRPKFLKTELPKWNGGIHHITISLDTH